MDDLLEESDVRLSEFLEHVRRIMLIYAFDGNHFATVEDSVAYILEDFGKEWTTLVVDAPLREVEQEEQAFDALMSSGRITGFSLEGAPSQARNSVPRLLTRGLPKMQRFENALFTGCSMDAAEAEEIFSAFRDVKSPREVAFVALEEYDDAVLTSFTGFVRESTSLEQLVLSYSYADFVPMQNLNAFRSICEAVWQSSSLRHVSVMGSPVEGESDYRRAAASLADAVSTSTSLSKLEFADLLNAFMPRVKSALLQTTACKTLDLGFNVVEDSIGGIMTFMRPSPWKSLLSYDIPLSAWSLILAETKAWEGAERSHTSRDILFFLLKEKNNVLLQNVKRRRIRKRKRYGYDSC